MVSLFLCLNVASGIVYHQVKWYLGVSAEEGRIKTDGRKVIQHPSFDHLFKVNPLGF